MSEVLAYSKIAKEYPELVEKNVLEIECGDGSGIIELIKSGIKAEGITIKDGIKDEIKEKVKKTSFIESDDKVYDAIIAINGFPIEIEKSLDFIVKLKNKLVNNGILIFWSKQDRNYWAKLLANQDFVLKSPKKPNIFVMRKKVRLY